MARAYILVEGQTEETFVRELLEPRYSHFGLYLAPILLRTGSGHKGGVVSYAQVKPQIERLCKQEKRAYVTTMLDLYALPRDFPGNRGTARSGPQRGAEKARLIEAQMQEDIGLHNFVPYIQVHEFEALLFAAPQHFDRWADKKTLEKIVQAADAAPEEINETPQGAPSKRILACMPEYQKTLHGPLIARAIGLKAMRETCPHFAEWLDRLDGLARAQDRVPVNEP